MYSKEDVRKAMKFITLMLIDGYQCEETAEADLNQIENEELRSEALAHIAAAANTLMMMKIMGI